LAPNDLDRASLDVLGTVAERLADRDHEAIGPDRFDLAGKTVAPPGLELDAEDADIGARHEGGVQGIAGQRPSSDLERSWIGGGHEPG
jgi:hypothetical protein